MTDEHPDIDALLAALAEPTTCLHPLVKLHEGHGTDRDGAPVVMGRCVTCKTDLEALATGSYHPPTNDLAFSYAALSVMGIDPDDLEEHL